MLTITIDTARRFILGKQGLWPGRRWRGIAGTEQAMRAMEYLQLDPLQIVARSHDITLYYLWRTGEVMTHHRENFERVYALTETVALAHLIRESDEAEADRFLIKKEVSFSGLSRLNRTSDSWQRGEPDRAAKKMLGTMLADGEIIEVQVEGAWGLR
jgi:uncharacterized protein YcaQ